MVKIILNIRYCSKCGDCCLLDCKSELYDGSQCFHPDKSPQCEMFPIIYLRDRFHLRECKGVAFELIPLKDLNKFKSFTVI